MKSKEFSAWLEVDGAKLPEWATMRIGNSIECYVESMPGQNFAVHWSCEDPDLFSSGYIFIDGKPYPGRFLQGQSTTHRSGARSGPNTQRNFAFMETKRAGKVIGEDQHPLGTVQLKIVLTERGEGRPNTYTQATPASEQPDKLVARQSGHRAGLGEDKPTTAQFPKTWEGKPIGAATPHSYVKFIFKYRPMDWIKSYGIDDIVDMGGCEGVDVPMEEEVVERVTLEEFQEAAAKFMRYIVETEGAAAARRYFPNMQIKVSCGPTPTTTISPFGENVATQASTVTIDNAPTPASHLVMPADWGMEMADASMTEDWSLPDLNTPQNVSDALVIPPLRDDMSSTFQYPANAYPPSLNFPSPDAQQLHQIAVPTLLQSPFQQRALNAAAASSPMWADGSPASSAAPTYLPAELHYPTPKAAEPQPVAESEDEDDEPTPEPEPQPRPKRKYRTKEQIAADNAAKQKARDERDADLERRYQEQRAKRVAAGEKLPETVGWQKYEEEFLAGRTWSEIIGPRPDYKGYKFTKGSKPSLAWKADQEKAAAERAAAEAEAGDETETEAGATSSSKGKGKAKAKAKAKGKGKEKEKAPAPSSEPQPPSQSYVQPLLIPIRAGPSASGNAQASSSRAGPSSTPMGGPQQIHGFLNQYAPVQAPGPANDPPRTRAPAVIPMLTKERYEELMRQTRK